MRYAECYKLALQKFDLTEKPNFPTGIKKWYAYKGGEVQIFETEKDAKNYSNNIEIFIANQKDIDDVYATAVNVEREASEIFHKTLREKYSSIPDSIYNRCYAMAYDDSHSDGHDAVADSLNGYILFALDIIRCSKNEETL